MKDHPLATEILDAGKYGKIRIETSDVDAQSANRFVECTLTAKGLRAFTFRFTNYPYSFVHAGTNVTNLPIVYESFEEKLDQEDSKTLDLKGTFINLDDRPDVALSFLIRDHLDQLKSSRITLSREQVLRMLKIIEDTQLEKLIVP